MNHIKIEIPEVHKGKLLSFYKEELTRLTAELSAVRSVIQQLQGEYDLKNDGVIMNEQVSYTFKYGNTINELTSVKYNKDGTKLHKAQYFIDVLGRPLSTGEIADYIVNVEPQDRTKLVQGLSSVLSQSAKRGALKKYKDTTTNEYVYFLPDAELPDKFRGNLLEVEVVEDDLF